MTNLNVTKEKKEVFTTSRVVKIGLLAAVSLVLMMLEFVLPIFPSFLKLDISDIPAVIGTLAMGPVAGIMVELIKNVLHAIMKTSSMGVGELANFIVATAYIVPFGIIYNRNKNTQSVVLGSIVGIISMIVIACVFNYFVLIPVYSKIIYNTPIDVFVGMAGKVNPMIDSFIKMILLAIAPFNLVKGIIMSVIGYWLYKILKPVLHKF
jgi:riboflavin transporter FmnP